ncbi:hypothetical protein EMPS_02624 [Entomortierella parvispora]|uniref:N-acetyltransferase domain-containing protein n=1 Tax=Entomortierella parvispora TaxID=205924 RepID=A0A9P3H530_9FUNG|nr:hypothetical protein EMPS_02624 [Entomortierella parvispora]
MVATATGSRPAAPSAGPFRVSDSIFLTVIEATDEEELYRILNINDTIANGLHSAKMVFPFPRDGATYFIQRQVSQRINKGIVHNWAIRPSIDGPMIGLVHLDDFDHGDVLGPCFRDEEAGTTDSSNILRCGAFGYWLSPEWAGKGIMTNVIRYSLQHITRSLFGFERVHAEAWLDNTASIRVMEKAGMCPARGVPCFVEKFNATKEIAHFIYDVEETNP